VCLVLTVEAHCESMHPVAHVLSQVRDEIVHVEIVVAVIESILYILSIFIRSYFDTCCL